MYYANYDLSFILLHISTVMIGILFILILRRKVKTQLHKVFIFTLGLQLIWCLGTIISGYVRGYGPQFVLYAEYIAYLGVCLLPAGLLLTGIIYVHTKVKLRLRHYLLFLIPVISLIMLWTNSYHGLFYEKYSVVSSEIIFGKYFIVHTIYSYVCILGSLYYFLSFSVKNSGFFSKQAIMIIVGTIVPLLVNIFVTLNIIEFSPYTTPLSFSFAIICYLFAILKYDFLSIAPVALQNVVDRISDSFVVLDENLFLIDFNKTFSNTFGKLINIKRNTTITELLNNSLIDKEKADIIIKYIQIARDKSKTVKFDAHMHYSDFNRYFTVEITPIIVNSIFIGVIILLKDITQNVIDLETIKQKQAILMEQERLASLGQLIGGIAHNLKTPIMSIAGGLEALRDLVTEYNESIGDSGVTIEDHHEIAREMLEWIDKVKPYCTYMSDVISAVKGQAVNLNESSNSSFTLGELLKRVDILMNHELKKYHCKININSDVDMFTEFKGEVNNLVQVFDNIIVNAIQSYGDKSGEIDLGIVEKDGNIVFSFKDYGPGIPADVQKKLFKEMFTTKGKFGTGLGLYMSYSTIKGRFNGDMWFESKLKEGATFYISIPYKKLSENEDDATVENTNNAAAAAAK